MALKVIQPGQVIDTSPRNSEYLRKLAAAMMQQGQIRTVGQGINSAAKSLAGAYLAKQAQEREAKEKAEIGAIHGNATEAMAKGLPGWNTPDALYTDPTTGMQSSEPIGPRAQPDVMPGTEVIAPTEPGMEAAARVYGQDPRTAAMASAMMQQSAIDKLEQKRAADAARQKRIQEIQDKADAARLAEKKAIDDRRWEMIMEGRKHQNTMEVERLKKGGGDGLYEGKGFEAESMNLLNSLMSDPSSHKYLQVFNKVAQGVPQRLADGSIATVKPDMSAYPLPTHPASQWVKRDGQPAPDATTPQMGSRGGLTVDEAEKKKLPADLASKIGLAEDAINVIDNKFIKAVEEGALTGPYDQLLSRLGWGKGGQGKANMRREIMAMSEAIVRMLTGAAMTESEAQERIAQYLPALLNAGPDAANKLRQGIRRLKTIINVVRDGVSGQDANAFFKEVDTRLQLDDLTKMNDSDFAKVDVMSLPPAAQDKWLQEFNRRKAKPVGN